MKDFLNKNTLIIGIWHNIQNFLRKTANEEVQVKLPMLEVKPPFSLRNALFSFREPSSRPRPSS